MSGDQINPERAQGSIQIDENYRTIKMVGTGGFQFKNYTNAQVIIDLDNMIVMVPSTWKVVKT